MFWIRTRLTFMIQELYCLFNWKMTKWIIDDVSFVINIGVLKSTRIEFRFLLKFYLEFLLELYNIVPFVNHSICHLKFMKWTLKKINVCHHRGLICAICCVYVSSPGPGNIIFVSSSLSLAYSGPYHLFPGFFYFCLEACISGYQEKRKEKVYSVHSIMANINLGQDVANKRERK